MAEEQLGTLIDGCIRKDRKSQKALYKTFYGFSISICLRYVNNRSEAAEVLNQGFFKVFTNIEQYDQSKSFKAWLGRIMMNVSIDYYRANLKANYAEELSGAEHVSYGEEADKDLSYHDLLAMIQKLPKAYRTVFSLFAIDGYTHEEIGEMLHINIGTSKSNLFKARQKLKQMILHADMVANQLNCGLNSSPVACSTHLSIC